MRAVLKLAGLACLGLAVAGAALPVLPSTPFALLAAWCLARGDEAFHRRLRESALFGQAVRDWEDQRAVSTAGKRWAAAALTAAGVAVWAMDSKPPVKVAAWAAQAAVLLFVCSRPSPRR